MWSYASYWVQCGVSSSHSTYCGYWVRDYHISFRLFALSNPSVPTLCLKDSRRGVETLQPGLLLRVRLYEWIDYLATERIENTRCLTNNEKLFLLKQVSERINNKQMMFAFLANKKEERISREEEWRCSVVRVTLTSLMSGTLNFCKDWWLLECLGSRMEGMLLWDSWVSSWSLFPSPLKIRFYIPFYKLKTVSYWLSNKRQVRVILPLVSQS